MVTLTIKDSEGKTTIYDLLDENNPPTEGERIHTIKRGNGFVGFAREIEPESLIVKNPIRRILNRIGKER